MNNRIKRNPKILEAEIHLMLETIAARVKSEQKRSQETEMLINDCFKKFKKYMED